MTDPLTADRPNPGSKEALDQGCSCAVMDNNHGKFPPYPATDQHEAGWWITQGCPVHNPEPAGADAT